MPRNGDGNEDNESAGGNAPNAHGRWPRESMRPLQPRLLVPMVAVAAIGLGACTGVTSPGVASLGRHGTGGGVSTTTLPTGSVTELLNEWATCMRRHGDPDQTEPTVDTAKVIQVVLPDGYTEGLGGPPGRSCAAYLTAAQTTLLGGEPPPTPDVATADKFAQCMRANGIPDYPDPTGTGPSAIRATPGSDLDPANPKFQSAATLCANKTGFEKFGSGTPQPGSVNLSRPGGFGGKPSGNSGP